MPAQARTSNAARARAEIPPYQPHEYPITTAQARQIESLSQSHSFAKLKKHLQDANDTISTMAGDINDRSMIMQETHKRRRARRAEQGLDDDENEEERVQEVGEYKETAERMTDEMEVITRDIIDSSERVKATENTLKDLAGNTVIGPRASQARINGHRRRRLRGSISSGSDDSEYGGSQDEDPAENHPRPLEMLQKTLSQHKTQYESQSLRARYANHNNYIGFKRVVHDSRNPDDNAPPLPNSSTWFPSEERSSGVAVSRTRRGPPAPAENGDDDDIEIEGERISLTCPLTLLLFKDPVSSKKCPHSFERNAILPMIENSEARIGGFRRGEGERAVKCPVCEQMITVNDLYSDKVLLRRIKRHEHGAGGSDGEGEGGPGGTQLEEISEDFGEDIDGFDDRGRISAARRSIAPKVKAERAKAGRVSATSSRPQVEYNSSGAVTLDLGEEEDDGSE
ncbi:hypothetical protein FGG08_005374 [Glutinoglossum americanum]|uniref:SP-RING-type domain-containing protein n=1 Tax=Glutinoglossum americanum TaxID=1670608 RepID=A0A9P8I5L2_9PEZI|nr:hypothetical protein FGG08_005374 [Glutinoglossum americanum]